MKVSKIGVVGLGAMGIGVARSLLRKGFEVHACDVRPQVLEAIAAEGAHAHATPASLAARVDALIVLVVNADQTETVLFGENGAAGALKPGGIVMASSTVPPHYAEELGARLAKAGFAMLDAPVSGGAARAASGEMTVMASGAPEAFDAMSEVLDAVAAKVYRLGDAPGMGSKVKMINQLLAGVHIAAATEAMALGIRAGIDPDTLYEVISNSAGNSWMFSNRVPHILAGDYTPLSAVNIFVKDLGIVLDSARKMTFPLPLTSSALQMFIATSASGLGGEDDSAVIKMFQRLTGIDLPEPKKEG
ncbi:NAD(P)-binding domain-containing protein [Burkholderiaceae bacterium FT117]|nr:NAD(P)-binding domain-containing protein [Zeimonas sediminis]